ncbi:hypothetical protein THRCLA_22257 [Thraustotheca clavata]|uniref:Secreted protein n=1 Tax=Thraustotheca clavata TaxID=74557 RepID=A0A1V9Z865_9STRA|nr:hypothetical protein THRCLA_22257 [Thraustotheca clavata]
MTQKPTCVYLLWMAMMVQAQDNSLDSPGLQEIWLGLPLWAWILIVCFVLVGLGVFVYKRLNKKLEKELPVVYVKIKTSKSSSVNPIVWAQPAPPPTCTVV